MFKVIEYTDAYRNRAINFWLEICVGEFGFKNWEKDILNMDNGIYKCNDGNFWIAINEDDTIIGTIALKNLNNGVGLVKSMYVRKQYRSQGISKILIEKLIEFVQEKEYKKLQLESYKEFTVALKLYEKYGFVKKGNIGETMLFEKELSGQNG